MEPLFLRRRPLPGNRSPLRIRLAVAWVDLVTSKASTRVSTGNSPRGGEEVGEAGRTSVCPPSPTASAARWMGEGARTSASPRRWEEAAVAAMGNVVSAKLQSSVPQESCQATSRGLSTPGEYVHLTKELLTSCESIERQVDELEKTITVASRDTAYYGLEEVELSRRGNWIGSACNQDRKQLHNSLKTNLENFPVIHHEEWSEITYYWRCRFITIRDSRIYI